MRFVFRICALLVVLAQPVWAQSNSSVVKADTKWQVGDEYSYRRLDVFSKVSDGQPYTLRVTGVDDGRVSFNNGRVIEDLNGNRISDSTEKTQNLKEFADEYFVGKEWQSVYTMEVFS